MIEECKSELDITDNLLNDDKQESVESDCSELSASEIPEEHDVGQTHEEYTH